MASHSEDKNFMCPYCQKTFKTNVLCKKHMKVHKSGKPTMPPNQDQQVNLDAGQANPLMTSQPTYYTADSSGIITIPIQPSTNLSALQTNPVNSC
jgi:hypothetical protein